MFFLHRFLSVISYLQDTLHLEFMVVKGPVYETIPGTTTNYQLHTDLDIYPLNDVRDFAEQLVASDRFIAEINPEQTNFLAIEEVRFIDKESGLIIDLHRSLFEPYLGKAGKHIDQELQKSRWGIDILLNSTSIKTLPLAHHCFYLLLHGEKHLWEFKKDRINWYQSFGALNDTQQQAYFELASNYGVLPIHRVAIELIIGKESKLKAKEEAQLQFLKQIEAAAYPKTMFQIWRMSNLCYHWRAAASKTIFIKRLVQKFCPILPRAVYSYPKRNQTQLQITHIFRMLRLIPEYKEIDAWEKACVAKGLK